MYFYLKSLALTLIHMSSTTEEFVKSLILNLFLISHVPSLLVNIHPFFPAHLYSIFNFTLSLVLPHPSHAPFLLVHPLSCFPAPLMLHLYLYTIFLMLHLHLFTLSPVSPPLSCSIFICIPYTVVPNNTGHCKNMPKMYFFWGCPLFTFIYVLIVVVHFDKLKIDQ